MGHEQSKEQIKKEIEEHSAKLRHDIADDMEKKFKYFAEQLKNVAKKQEKNANPGKLPDFETHFQEQSKSIKTNIADEMKNQLKKIKTEMQNINRDQNTKVTQEFQTLKTQLEEQGTKTKKDVSVELASQITNFKEDLKNHIGTAVGLYVIIALQILVMITAIMLISSSVHISNAKPCELETALDYIFMEYTPHPCKYNTIKETSKEMLALGITDLSLNFLVFFLFLVTCLWQFKNKENWTLVCFVVVAVLGLSFSISALYTYSRVAEKEGQEATFDFLHLESSMQQWLEKHFKSDNTTNGEPISVGWNNFFIRYDCCAVSEVIGTTNDFDKTPWCTTSGSCQATSSQIPKTCCKSVSLTDYQNAPSQCYASVNDGTYKQSCISRMKLLRRENINEFHIVILSISLLTLGVLQGIEVVFAILFFIEKWRSSDN